MFLRTRRSDLHLRWTLREGTVEVEVSDHGPLDLQGRAAELSILLIEEVVDSLKIADNDSSSTQTRVILTKRIG